MIYGGLTVSQVVGIPAGSYLSYLFGWTILFWGVTAAGLAMAAALAVLTPRGIKVAPATLSDLAAVLTDPRLAVAVLLTATAMGSAWTAYTFLAPIIEVKTGGGPELVGLLLGGLRAGIGRRQHAGRLSYRSRRARAGAYLRDDHPPCRWSRS